MIRLYVITNRLNGKMYVGITSGTVKDRWVEHIYASKSAKNKFHRAIRKYEVSNFELLELFQYSTRKGALAAEVDLIAALKLVAFGYNSTPGGEISPMAEGPHAAAIRAKASASRIGMKFSTSHIANLSAARLGRRFSPHSAETRAKIAKAHEGKVLTNEHRLKLSASHTGKKLKPHSPEVRARIALSNRVTGLWKSERGSVNV